MVNAGIDYGAKQTCERAPAKMDAAWLTIVTNDPDKHMPELTLYAQMDVCYKVHYEEVYQHEIPSITITYAQKSTHKDVKIDIV